MRNDSYAIVPFLSSQIVCCKFISLFCFEIMLKIKYFFLYLSNNYLFCRPIARDAKSGVFVYSVSQRLKIKFSNFKIHNYA